ncbi:MAG: HlyD family efflux transporter periplasmic adaptor subunit [Candidatus Gracilibacteria bacterium]
MGILTEIDQNKTRKRFTKTIIFIVFIILSSGAYYIYNKQKNTISNHKFTTVIKKDLSLNFSSDGKVYYKDQYELNFQTSGVLQNIYKNEGDNVKKGEIIASLDDKYLKINVDKASIALDTARANLNAKIATKGQVSDVNISKEQLKSSETSLDTTIKQGEKDVETAKANLDNVTLSYNNLKESVKQDLETAIKNVETKQKDLDNSKDNLQSIIDSESLNVKNAQEKTITEINIALPLIEKYIRDTDVLLGITDQNRSLNDSFENFLGAKDITTKSLAENSFNLAFVNYQNYKNEWTLYQENIDLSQVGLQSNKVLSILDNVDSMLKNTKEMLKNSISSLPNFSQSVIDGYILNIDSNINGLQFEIQKIVTVSQNIDSALSNLDTKKISAENQIKSAELQLEQANISLDKIKVQSNNSLDDLDQKYNLAKIALETANTRLQNNIDLANSQINISKANLDYKTSKFDARELEPYYTAIKNAQKGLEESKARLDDAYLRSPIDGKIGKLSSAKIGTNIQVNPNSPFVVIIKKDSLYIEAKIEEGDIKNIKINQEVKITFNSLEGVELKGKVSYISDKAETDINGIVTYKVEVIFENMDSSVKEGFTTQLYFLIEKKNNILVLPMESVLIENGVSSVTLEDNTKKIIQTGINDGDYIEIINGLSEGDKVIY